MPTKLSALNRRWRIERLLGEGADAQVFLATDLAAPDLPYRALKVLRATDDQAEARLRFEFASLAALSHPALVRVFDVGRVERGGAFEQGQLFFAAEWVEGRSPAVVLDDIPQLDRARRLIDWLGEIASALDAIHSHGLIHHDIKPDNLFIDTVGKLRIFDLGLAAARAGRRGTPRYLAPEAFLGQGDARVDLYSVGVTFTELITGQTPDDLPRVLSRTNGPSALSTIAGKSAPVRALVRILQRLSSPDPADRHQTARALLDDALRSGATLDGKMIPAETLAPLAQPAFVGRADALRDLERALTEHRSCIAVVGPAGSGRTRLIEEGLRRETLRSLAAGEDPITIHGPTSARARSTLGVAVAFEKLSEGGKALDRRQAIIVGELCDRLAKKRSVLWLSDEADPLCHAMFEAALAGAIGLSTVIVELTGQPSLVGATQIEIGPLNADATLNLVQSMRGDLSAAFARAVHRGSGGIPKLAVELVRLAASDHAQPTAADLKSVESAVEPRELARFKKLSVETRSSLAAVAVLGGSVALTQIDTVATVAALESQQVLSAMVLARAAGILIATESDSGEQVFAIPLGKQRVIEDALSVAERKRLHQRALDHFGSKVTPEMRARHLAVIGSPNEAFVALMDAGVVARSNFNFRQAMDFFSRAAELEVPRIERNRALIQLAEIEVAIGDYRSAGAHLAGVDGAVLLRARIYQRQGDASAAEVELRRALGIANKKTSRGATDVGLDERGTLRGLLARVLYGRGALDEALEVCTAEPLPPGESAIGIIEVLGLLYLARDRFDDAERTFLDGESRARQCPDLASLARMRSLCGTLAEMRGDTKRARAIYEEAIALADRSGDLHGAAVYAQNLAGIYRAEGEYTQALAAVERATRQLGHLGKRIERAGALFNLGSLLFALGDLDGADHAVKEAGQLAEGQGGDRLRGAAHFLAGELLRRREDRLGALELFELAARTWSESGDRVNSEAARLVAAELLAELGRGGEARDRIAAAPSVPTFPMEESWRCSRARIDLFLNERLETESLDHLELAAARAHNAALRPLCFQLEITIARAAIHRGEARRAESAIERAQTQWKEIVMRTPDAYRDRIETDPDAKKMRALVEAGGSPSRISPARPEDARLRRLVAINKRLTSELRLGPLLELVIDAVIDLTEAERGFILLRKPSPSGDGELEIKVSRNIDQRAVEGNVPGQISLSRSIAEQSVREGAPVVTLDAAGDHRFEAARSVADLKLRSVLAAPLIARGEVVGCLYVDHRLRSSAFGEEDIALVMEFADQAALAVENARLIAENQSRAREVADLAKRLEAEVASQRAELGSMSSELRESRAALQVRYDYRNLVGRTPRMLELFRLLDRVTDTALPVVIYGESGTGKEIVARAIHHNGPRATRSFVTENCAAIPENLLEAALFGHTRGAFTGAEAERRGLFEIADGGTLFLDEVGEMSPGMQSKLLRVLQDGEFRRIGGERSKKVDVRILVASNRDLATLVEQGKFRQDLFYRLNVVHVALPPLRERSEDIPILVEHFLRKYAPEGGEPKRIARAALAKLVAHRWPGNVRELENEIMRASALGGATIVIDDLSPQIASGDGEIVPAADDLSLHRGVERLERRLIREALGKTDGNQSHAARLLGLSRFGLQKKLKRYGISQPR